MKTTEKIKLEIRAAEGGEDAKLLVNEMADIYKKAASINSFAHSVEH
jgi:protein subunit release factor A